MNCPNSFEEFKKCFKTFKFEDSDKLNIIILERLKLSNNNVLEKNYKVAFKNFQKDYGNSKKRVGKTVLKENLIKKSYGFIWEQIILLSLLDLGDLTVINYSFRFPNTKNSPEKDFLFEFKGESYHLEVTGKFDIERSVEEELNLTKNKNFQVSLISNKNITDNSIFDYKLKLKKDIPKFNIDSTYKVLFIYNQKGSFYYLQDFKNSIQKLIKKHVVLGVLFRPLNVLGEEEISKSHLFNFKDNDKFIIPFLKKVEEIIKLI